MWIWMEAISNFQKNFWGRSLFDVPFDYILIASEPLLENEKIVI